ncbi:hypothetical protein [Paraburkholderia sp. GAS32]|uniref:hypothetical protein n=1 Tax=Paraburkholderia sp. GAS32 TaxID=3035129 RepID=UPI003D25DD3B
MISDVRMGRMTQGTVFCGTCAEEYPGRPVCGIVITARCDTTHEKTPIVNYLPVVTVEGWLQSHGGLMSIGREYAETRNRFKNLLVKKQLSETPLEVHSPIQIAAFNFPYPEESAGQKAAKERKDADEVRAIASRMNELTGCLDSPPPPKVSANSADSENSVSYATHQRLYVAITRARYRIALLGVKARGMSEVLGSAETHGLIQLEQ